MVFATKRKEPSEVEKQTYAKIMNFYDLAEEFLTKTEEMGEKAEPYIDEVEKIVGVLETNTEILLNCFLKFIETNKKPTELDKIKMKRAMDAINSSVTEFIENTGD